MGEIYSDIRFELCIIYGLNGMRQARVANPYDKSSESLFLTKTV